MGAQVMLNVRMDKGLKAEGDSVLAHAGTSATEALALSLHGVASRGALMLP